MKIEGATLKKYLIIFLIWEMKNFYQKNKSVIYMNYLKNEIESVLNLMKTLMIIHTMMDLKKNVGYEGMQNLNMDD